MFNAITSNFNWSDPSTLATLHDRPWTGKYISLDTIFLGNDSFPRLTFLSSFPSSFTQLSECPR